MESFGFVIQSELGIHARPAGLLVRQAQQFSSSCVLEKDGKTANMKKLFALMGLNVKQGEEIRVTIEGPDEQTAVKSLKVFMKANF